VTAWIKRQRWWMYRTAMLPVHLTVFAIITFFLIKAIPGDPVVLVGGNQLTPAEYHKIQHSLGLDGGMPSQFGRYMGNFFTLHLGKSPFTGQSVWGQLKIRLPATVELALMALFFATVISLLGAYLVLSRPRNPISRVLTVYSRGAGSIPQYLVAVFAIFFFYAKLHWVPAPLGRLSPNVAQVKPLTNFPMLDAILRGRWDAVGSMWYHLLLPLAVLALTGADLMIKILVRSLNDEVDSAPTWFRIASGAPRSKVILSIYRRALPGLVILIAALFGSSIGGAVLLENLFNLGALGQYAVDAIHQKDTPALQGFLLLAAAVSLVVFLIVDLVNMIIDPRRRPGVTTEAAL
jgi:peptide/nickel transport system permease protein